MQIVISADTKNKVTDIVAYTTRGIFTLNPTSPVIHTLMLALQDTHETIFVSCLETCDYTYNTVINLS